MATQNEAEKKLHALRRRRRLRQLLGALVCVLVVIGLGSVISGGVHLTMKMFDNTEEMKEYEQRLQVLVSFDPEPFDSLETANRTRLLDAAIWTVIQQNRDKLDTYERNEYGAMYLPTLDIDREIASLYGPDLSITYDTFSDGGVEFIYVPEKNAYLMPITSVNGSYAPRVVSIRRSGRGVKRVTVGYLDLYGNTSVVFDPTQLEPVKYLDYIFTEKDGGYYLSAITRSEMSAESAPDESSSSSAAAAPEQVMDQVTSALPESAVSAESTDDDTDEK